MMKAMILAAGRGSRLKPLTDSIPKCLVEIGGKPILEHVVDRLKAVGVTSLVINVSYLRDQVLEVIQKKNNFGIEVFISDEEELLETGGGLKKAASHLSDVPYFFLYNADIFSSLDLDAMRRSHEESGALATLATFKHEAEPRCFLFDDDSVLCGWRNRSTGDEKIVRNVESYMELGFMGVHIVSREMLMQIQSVPEEKFSIVAPYLSAVQEGGQIKAHIFENPDWHDIGTMEQLEKVRALYACSSS